jgi:hypothetical protein
VLWLPLQLARRKISYYSSKIVSCGGAGAARERWYE